MECQLKERWTVLNKPKNWGAGDSEFEEDELICSSEFNTTINVEKELLIRPPPTKGCVPSCRTTLAVVAFLGFVNIYWQRVNLSVAIIAMVNSTYITTLSNVTECLRPNTTPKAVTDTLGEFEWDQTVQGMILGSFFYGYIWTCIPGGYLAQRYGGKWIYGPGVLITSVLTTLTPLAARHSVHALVGVRVLEGMAVGVTLPTMHAMWALWAPKLERSRLMSFTYAGSHLGTVIALPVTSVIASSKHLGGWPVTFYLPGAVGCVWFLLWVSLVYNSPAEHPRISCEERTYIQKSLGTAHNMQTVPWLHIGRSSPVWAIAVAHFCCHWGFFTMLTSLPTYLSQVLHFRLKENGMLAAVPYFGLFMIMTLCGVLADYLRSHKYLTTRNTRKVLIVIGFSIPAVLMIGVGYTGCNVPLALTIVILSVAILGFAFPGFMVNHVDIAPLYAGTLMGITNTIATIPGFVGPQIVGLFTDHEETIAQWHFVFIIAASVNLFGSLIYIIFGDGEEQWWARDHSTRN